MQSDSGSSRPVIGHLAEATGTVLAIAPDGTRRLLESGGALYLHDRVFTEPSQTASITLINNQSLSLDDTSRLVMVENMLRPSGDGDESETDSDTEKAVQEAIDDAPAQRITDKKEADAREALWKTPSPKGDSTKDIPRMLVIEHEGQDESGNTGVLLDQDSDKYRLSILETWITTARDGQILIGQIHTRTATPGTGIYYRLSSSPEGGSLTLNEDGSFQFNPVNDFQYLGAGESRAISFTFAVVDSLGNSELSSVDITVEGVNDPPLITGPAELELIQQEEEFTFDLLTNAFDPDQNDDLYVTNLRLVNGNEAGIRMNVEGTSLIVDPKVYRYLGEEEAETITYEYDITDSFESVSQTATITLVGTNDAPTVSRSVSLTSNEDAGIILIDLLAGASDIDQSDTLHASALRLTVGQPRSVTLTADGNSLEIETSAYAYLAEGESETFEYAYEVTDEHGASVTQKASITIEGRNDAPEEIILASTDITENASGVVVGTLSTIDKDLSDTHYYTVDDNRFEVVNGELRLKATEFLDHETEPTVAVTVNSKDFNGGLHTESFTINVSDINEAPASTDRSATINEESLYRFSLTDFPFSDEDAGDALAFIQINDLPAKGSLELNGAAVSAGDQIQPADIQAGHLTFLPDNRESGNNYASFHFRVSDGELTSELQTFTFNVAPVANLPSLSLTATASADPAYDYSISQNEDTSIPLSVTSFLSDSDGSETLGLQLSGVPAGSTVTDGTNTISADGTNIDISTWQLSSLSMLPPADSNTDFTLTVTATASESGNSDQASVSKTVRISLTAVDDAPDVNDVDLGSTFEEQNFTITRSDLLANSSDVDGDNLSITSLSLDDSTHGTLTDNGDDTWTFTPAVEFSADDIGFSFTVSDGSPGDERSATAILDVIALSDPPVLVDDSSMGEATIGGSAVTGSNSVLDNDSDIEDDTLTVTHINGTTVAPSGSVIAGSYGNLSIGADGNWIYTPKASLPGGGPPNTTLVDQFTYTVSDGQNSVSATLSINVNRSPDAQDGTLSTTEDSSAINGTLSALDRDIGEALTYAKLTDPSQGTVTVNPDGSYQFTPGADFQDLAQGESRTVSFTYQVTDSQGDSDTAQISITVAGSNDAPSAIALSSTTVDENDAGAIVGQLTVTDADTSNTHSFSVDDSRFEVVSGQLKLKDGISLDHETASSIIVNVTATDDHSAQKVQSFTLTVFDQNDAPVLASVVSSSITEDTGTQTISLLTGATDQDGHSPSISNLMKTSGDASGVTIEGSSLKIDTTAYQSLGNGDTETLTYTYNITDSNGGTVSQTATITITGTNDDAVITGTSVTTLTEDTDANIDGNLIATGSLSIADADSGEDSFTPDTHSGTYGTLVITSSGQWTYTASNSNSDIQALPANSTLTDTLSVTATDGTSKTITITLTGTNDSASITGTASGSVTEDTSVNGMGQLTVSSSLSVTDTDTGESSFKAESHTGSYGSLSIMTNGNWTYSALNSQNDIQNLGAGETLTDSFTVYSADNTSQAITVTITGTNDAPVISSGSTLSYQENAGALVIDNTIVLSDVDSANLSSATITISGYQSTEDRLAFSNQNGITSSWDSATGTLTLTGSATVSQYQSALRSITYANDSNDPDTSTRTISFKVNDGSSDSLIATSTINITAVDDTPESSHTSLTITEDMPHSFLPGDFAFTDAEGNTLQGIKIKTLPVQGELLYNGATATVGLVVSRTDLLAGRLTYQADAEESGNNYAIFEFQVSDGNSYSSPATITFHVNADNDVPTVSSAITASAVEDDSAFTLDLLQFATDIETPDNLGISGLTLSAGDSRGVTVSGTNLTVDPDDYDYLASGQVETIVYSYNVVDTGGETVAQTATITITGTDDTPLITGSASGSVTEDSSINGMGQITATGSLSVTDADTGESSFSALTHTGVYGSLAIASDGSWTYAASNTQNAIQALGDDDTLTDSFSVTTADGTSHSITITINGANDAPTVDQGLANQSASEEVAFSYQIPANAFADKDGDTLILSVSLSDDSPLPSWLSFDADTGTFSGTPDDGDVSNITVKVIADDGDQQVSSLFTITNTLTNDPPELSANPLFNHLETALTFDYGAGMTAIDHSGNGNDVAFSGSATWVVDRHGSGSAFHMDGTQGAGELSGITTGGAMTISTWVRFDSFDQMSSRIIDFGNGQASDNIVLYHKGNTGTLSFDLYGNSPIPHSTLEVADFFVINEWVHVAATIASDGTMKVYRNGQLAGEVAGTAPTEMVRSSNYIGKSHWSGDGYLDGSLDDFVLSGNNLNAAEINALYLAGSVVDVLADGFHVPENSASGTVVGTAAATDVDSANLMYSLTSDANGWFEIDGSTGEITVSAAASLNKEVEASYDITVEVSDGALTDSRTYTIYVTDVAEAPAVDAPITASGTDDSGLIQVDLLEGASVVDEGATLTADSVTLTAGDDSGISISGDTLTVDASAYAFLPDGHVETITYSYNLLSSTGVSTPQTVTITLTGANEIAVISGVDMKTLTEDTSNLLTTSGVLSVNDADTGESSFKVATIPGNYGSLQINALGTWSYSANNAQTAIQELGAGDTLTDTLTVQSKDGTPHSVVITIQGTNDAAVIGGVDTGMVIENAAETLIATGALTISDTDAGEDAFTPLTNQQGTYGSLSINALGQWSYSANNSQSALQSLNTGDSLIDTFSVSSVDGETHNIVITIHGTDGDATITGDNTATLTEDESSPNLTASGDLTVTDSDPGESSFTVANNQATTYGQFSINASGHWDYTASNANADIQALASGTNLTDVIIVTSVDGSAHIITITINGTDDAPVIGGVDTGTVTEDDGSTLSVSDQLTITDADSGEDEFTAGTINGTYGDLTIATDGSWTYTADNTQTAIQSLPDGSTLTDTLTVSTADGTTHSIVITINGVNDAAVFSGDDAGSVTEDTAVNGSGNLSASGTLGITDTDTGEALFTAETVNGAYGDLTINAAGSWSYEADNNQSAIQALRADDSLTDTLTVTSDDGSTHTVTITIEGTNDDAVITGTDTGAVTENAAATLRSSGTLVITDTDTGEDSFIAQSDLTGTYGALSITTDGQWSYEADNSHADIQALNKGDSLTDVFTVSALDGTTHTVTMTINGTDGDATIGGVDARTVTEDDTSPNLTASGLLTISDEDAGEEVFTVASNLAGTYGTLSINAAGSWTYTASNSQSAIQSLADGETLTDTITITSVDETAHAITITIQGTNDVPTIGGTSTATLVEDSQSPTLTATGTLTITDQDTGESAFVDESHGGSYGTLTIEEDGDWSYSAANNQAAIQSLGSGDSLTDTFSVQSTDSTTKSITITISGTDDAPVVSSIDLGDSDEDQPFTITSSALLASASDVDGDTLSVTSVTLDNSAYGSLTDNGDGTWTFNPTQDYNGEDVSFTFVVSDGTPGDEATTSATLDITALNDRPDLVDDSSTGQASLGGSQITGASSVLANDSDVESDPLTVTDVNGTSIAAAGTTSITGTYGSLSIAADGSWTYTPVASIPGNGQANTLLIDQFVYTVSDGDEQSTATLSINVNRTPEAQSGVLSVNEDGSAVNGTLSAMDRDKGDTLAYTEETGPTKGTLSITSTTGAYSYNPGTEFQDLAAGETEDVTFTYRVTDPQGDYSTATVTITVTGVNDDAVITDTGSHSVTEDAGSTLTTSGTLGISDADSGEGAFAPNTYSGTYGSVTINAIGEWSYSVSNSLSAISELGNGETLTDTIRLTTDDGTTYDLEVTINGTNDAPTLSTALTAQSVNEDQAFSFQVPANTFADAENNIDRYEASLSDGSVLPRWLNFDAATQTFYGTPDDGDVANLTVKVTAIDAEGLSADATFSLAINNVNDLPVPVFQEAGGLLSIEAENFHSSVSRSSNSWTEESKADASGGKVVTTTDNDQGFSGSVEGNSPELTYEVNFQTAGTYYVWIRGSATGGQEDSVHVGLNGNYLNSSGAITGFGHSGSSTWASTTMGGFVATINVASAGRHQINLWMREDGFKADKIVLTTDSEYSPTSTGPAESDFVGEAAQTATEETLFSYTIPSDAFVDMDADTLSFSASLPNDDPLPDWLSFNADSQTFSGTPDDADLGTITIKVTAADDSGSTDIRFSLTVNPVNDAPDLVDDSGSATVAGSLVTGSSTVLENDSDIESDPLTVTDVNGITVAASGNTIISGDYGDLTIDADGNWTYNPVTPDIDSDLVGLWRFDGDALDSASADTIADDGTLRGTASTSSSGLSENGLTLPTDGDALVIPDSTEINDGTVTARTISLAFKVDPSNDLTARQVLFEEGDTVRGLNAYIDNGILYVGGYDTSISWSGTWYSVPVPAGNDWHNISLVLGSDTLSAYMDRTLLTTVVQDIHTGSKSLHASHAELAFGSLHGDTVYHDFTHNSANDDQISITFIGQLDEARVYNRALTKQQINALHYEFETTSLTDRFTYTASDGTDSRTAPLTIDVNRTPRALSGTLTATEDGSSIAGQLSAIDYDAGEILTYELVTDASEGSTVVNTDGSYTFSPGSDFQDLAAGATRNVAFTYRVTDLQGDSSTSTVTITVTGTNDAPVLQVQTLDVDETSSNGTTVGTVSATDIDTGDSLEFSLTDDAGGRFAIDSTTGIITVANSGPLNHEAADSHRVTVQVDDGTATSTHDYYISITDINDAPTATDNTATVDEDTDLALTLSHFGFSDEDGDSLQKVKITNLPDSGTLKLSGVAVSVNAEISRADIVAGNLVFRAAEHESGNSYASIDFRVSDGTDYSASDNTLTFDVSAVADTPTLQINNQDGNETDTVNLHNANFGFYANYRDGWSGPNNYLSDGLVIDSSNSVGRTFNTSDSSAIGYTTSLFYAGYNGSSIKVYWDDVLIHTITNFSFSTLRADISLPVPSGNTAELRFDIDPDTVVYVRDIHLNQHFTGDPYYEIDEDHSVAVNLSSQLVDTDSSESLSVSVSGLPSGATISDGDGNSTTSTGTAVDISDWDYSTLSITPPQDYAADFSLTFTATATESGNSDTAAVTRDITIRINPLGDAATFGGNDTGSVTEDSSATATGSLTINDVDGASEESFTVDTITGTYGSLSINASGDWTYTIDNSLSVVQAIADSATETDVITVESVDGTTKAISITVNGVNDAPVLPDASLSVNENSSNSASAGTISATDVDGDSLTYSLTNDAGGRFAINSNTGEITVADGSLLDHETSAAHTVTVQVDDDITTVSKDYTISINDINEIPEATDNTLSVDEDDSLVLALADFGFTDVDDGDTLSKVQITALPASGSLRLNGASVSLNDEISSADIVAGNLIFEPAEDASGDGYASLGFKVHDGTVYSASSNTLTIDVNPVADTPDLVTPEPVILNSHFNGGATDGWHVTNNPSNQPFSHNRLNVWNGTQVYRDVDTSSTVQTYELTFTLGMYRNSYWSTSATVRWGGQTVAHYVEGPGTGTYLSQKTIILQATGDPTTQLRFSQSTNYIYIDNVRINTLIQTNEEEAGSLDISALLADTDGSESLSVSVSGLPSGTVINDGGTNSATSTGSSVDVSGWDLSSLSITPPLNHDTDINMAFTATATEAGNSHQASITRNVTLRVNPVNDVAVISGEATGSVTEDTGVAATGSLSVSDVDGAREEVFIAETVSGTYGSVTIDTAGSWSYSLDNSLSAIQSLTAGSTQTDTVTVRSQDGTTKDITITINGAQEPATAVDDSSQATLDGSDISSSVSVLANDSDTEGDALTVTAVNGVVIAESGTTVVKGELGDLAIAADGTWTYTSNLNTDLVAHWTFNEASGTIASDSAPADSDASDGDLTHGATFVSGGVDGSAVQFDGGNALVNILDSSDLNIQSGNKSQRTIHFSFKLDSDNDLSGRQVLYEEGGGSNGYNIYIDEGSLYVGAWAESNSWNGTWLSVDISAIDSSLWHQVSLTMDSSSNSLKAYLDGTLFGSGAASSSMPNHGDESAFGGLSLHTDSGGVLRSSTKFHDGRHEALGTDPLGFNGMIDEARVYDRALTQPQISALQALFESGNLQEEFTYTVYDGTEPSTATLTIDVNRVPEALSGTLSATEDASIAGQLSSLELDTGDTQVYSVESQPSEGSVSVNADGSYTFNPGADFNDLTVGQSRDVTFDFRVTDAQGDFSTSTITVTVAGRNDAPVLQAQTLSVAENSSNGAAVGSVTANDVDSGASISYSLTDNAGGRFAIDSITGAITVADGTLLNHEDSGSHTVTVEANDGTDTHSLDYTVTITDENEAPVLQSQLLSVVENSSNSTVVGTITANDPDAGASISYSLTDDAGGRFAIDSSTGQITVADGSLLNHENSGAHTITVLASDGNLTHSLSYTVTVTDTNDAPTAANNKLILRDDASYTFSADDFNFSDEDPDSLSSITITSLPASGSLALDGTAVTANQVISAADISDLTYTPVAGDASTSFGFKVSDGMLTSAEQTFSLDIKQFTSDNLLTNPSATSGLSGWSNVGGGALTNWGTVSSTSHDGDSAAWVAPAYVPGGADNMQQTIDLVSLGYSTDFLNSIPTLNFSGWAIENNGGTDFYTITATLFDASMTEIHSTYTSIVTDDSWQQVDFSLSSYGTGLRYVEFRQFSFDADADFSGNVDENFNDLDLDAAIFDDASLTVAEHRIDGSSDSEIIKGNAEDEALYGYGGNDILIGGGGDDLLFGGIGDDKLYGGADRDTLNGGADNDTLEGGAGDDTLTGGTGSDTFVYKTGDTGTDDLPDFEIGVGGDILDLRDLLVDADLENNDLVDYLHPYHVNDYIKLAYSPTPNGVSTLEIKLTGDVSAIWPLDNAQQLQTLIDNGNLQID